MSGTPEVSTRCTRVGFVVVQPSYLFVLHVCSRNVGAFYFMLRAVQCLFLQNFREISHIPCFNNPKDVAWCADGLQEKQKDRDCQFVLWSDRVVGTFRMRIAR